ncbi:hypothetical protein LZ31DRAFT_261870 [Colletotrichum somersetense]|nr:hypothetical protein LZ31DRAFT_261870 [Colletotrichum somersetense]
MIKCLRSIGSLYLSTSFLIRPIGLLSSFQGGEAKPSCCKPGAHTLSRSWSSEQNESAPFLGDFLPRRCGLRAAPHRARSSRQLPLPP